MNWKRFSLQLGCLVLTCAFSSFSFRAEAQNDRLPRRNKSLPADATRCDVSIPIRIELAPLNEPEVGKVAKFQVKIESLLDPDLVEDMRVEYELPSQLRLEADNQAAPAVLLKSGRSQFEMGVRIPDESRYAIRARLVVRLTNGKTIGQTAIRWVDLGDEDPPEGMIGRIVNADGTGIRVYPGVTVRN